MKEYGRLLRKIFVVVGLSKSPPFTNHSSPSYTINISNRTRGSSSVLLLRQYLFISRKWGASTRKVSSDQRFVYTCRNERQGGSNSNLHVNNHRTTWNLRNEFNFQNTWCSIEHKNRHLDDSCAERLWQDYTSDIKASINGRCSVFDPLGGVSPVTVQAKMFLQTLWKDNLQWDEVMPLRSQLQWDDIVNNRQSISSKSHDELFQRLTSLRNSMSSPTRHKMPTV